MFKRKSECQKAKGLLSPYIDQQLSSSERVLVKKHLAKCAVCSAELESLKATVNLLHRVPVVSPPRSFAIAEVESRRRRAPFALVSTATAVAASAMAFFFVGDAFDLFGQRITEEGVKRATPPPAPEAYQALDAGEVGSQIAEKWPVWQIEIALIGVVVVLGAVTFILWRRRRRAVGARVGRA
jgi:anti-sigma factor RsiW